MKYNSVLNKTKSSKNPSHNLMRIPCFTNKNMYYEKQTDDDKKTLFVHFTKKSQL